MYIWLRLLLFEALANEVLLRMLCASMAYSMRLCFTLMLASINMVLRLLQLMALFRKGSAPTRHITLSAMMKSTFALCFNRSIAECAWSPIADMLRLYCDY